MSNPFSLKKEVPKSYFKAATMIIHKDMGKGKSKKFLFDYNACEALKIDGTTCVAFIVNPPHLFLADISHLDKEKWGIGDQEFNLFNKNVEYLDIEENRYRFRTFSNSALYNVLMEEYELNRDAYNIYSLSIVSKQDFPLFLDEESCKMMDRMEIEILYQIELFDSISSFDSKKYYKLKTFNETLQDYLKNTSVYKPIHSSVDGSVVEEEPKIETNSDYDIRYYPQVPNEATKEKDVTF